MVIDTRFGAAIMAFRGIHARRISILLIVAVLATGMVGCVSSPAQHDLSTPTHYYLTISCGERGRVTALGEGTFTCDEGEVVNLVADPASGCRFVEWTGDAEAIENVEAPSTTITVSGDCSTTANFEPIPMARQNLTTTSSSGGWVASPGMGTFGYDRRRLPVYNPDV